MPNRNFQFVLVFLRKTIFNFQFRRGFSLIELMVVITLFGLSASLVTASYLSFERNQRVKNGAIALKNDLRLVQNKAYTGDIGPRDASYCTYTDSLKSLGGWYLKIQASQTGNIQTTYSYGGICSEAAINRETILSQKTLALPRDIKVYSVTYASGSQSLTYPLVIFFRSLSSDRVTFHQGDLVLPSVGPPDFFKDDGSGLLDETTKVNPYPSDQVLITLSSMDETRKYQVRIEPSGEIYELKP